MRTTSDPRTQARSWGVGIAATGALTLAIGALGVAQGFPWTGWIVGGGLAVLVLCGVARHRALSHADESGPVARIWGGTLDERDRAVLDGALAAVGASAFIVLGIGNLLVVFGVATAIATLQVSLMLLIAIGVAAFAYHHHHR